MRRDNEAELPVGLLAHARAVLAGEHAVLNFQSARYAAFLARQALEETVRRWSHAEGMTDPRIPMRSRLIGMRVLLGEPTGVVLATTAWQGLSHACHHHAYELAPTTAEVQHLIDCVGGLVELIGVAGEGGDRP